MAMSMGRKPIDQDANGTPRERIWRAIREWAQGTRPRENAFNLAEIACRAKTHEKTTRDYLGALTASGHLEQSTIDGMLFWRLVRDSREAPRVRADGSPVTMGRGQEQMWAVLRLLPQGFCVADLVLMASTDEVAIAPSTAQAYLKALARAGYVVADGKTYTFLPAKWTGPKPVQLQRIDQVYDPNLRRVVWRSRKAAEAAEAGGR